jgi:streptogramin lyase
MRTPAQPRHIWISNSNESTISKISTDGLVEEARYVTRDDANGNPSRTSVNFNGDVAVANRSSGITVFAGDIADCPDPLDTSAGPADVRPYPDGCLLWSTPFNYASQRPVAWTQGQWSDETCRYEDTLLWTSGANATIDVILLDGETGAVVQTVPIPGINANFYGIYGGAVDGEGNFWGSMLGAGSIINVALADFEVTTYPMPVSGYGMTVDPNGMVWTCSNQAARLDPSTGLWDVFDAGGSGGCNVDGDGILWMANDPLVGLDIATGAVQYMLDVPAYVHGVAVDFDGYVWGAAIYNNEAYRIDPTNGAIDTVAGLNFPYTYSDMTGFGLQNVSM